MRFQKRHKEHTPEDRLRAILKVRITGALKTDLRQSQQGDRYPVLTMPYLIELYYQQGGRCALTGRDLSLAPPVRKKRADPDALSIDRINPDLPHVKGNVRFVTYHANLARNRFTDEQLLELCWDIVATFHNKDMEESIEDPESSEPDGPGETLES